MFDFLLPKTKIQSHLMGEIPLDVLEIHVLAQVNTYCNLQTSYKIGFTVVNFANTDKKFDEKETLVLNKYFLKRKCPKCKKIELIPTKIRLNFDKLYLKFEEEVAYGAYSEKPSKTNSPSYALAYCPQCQSAFEIKIKNKDFWAKQAKKIKPSDMVIPWEKYCLRADLSNLNEDY
ncbi:hypothetical protein IJ670_01005 [bacterium]|nr:hypothetical protein [bacterium]